MFILVVVFLVQSLGIINGITNAALVQSNVSYGTDRAQILDIYYPSSNSTPNAVVKIIMLVHGGSWREGDKQDMAEFISPLQQSFSDYYIANLNYRLGNTFSPGYPKQVDDIHSAVTFLKRNISEKASFVLFGVSAGAHLSMLYSYSVDSAPKGNKGVAAVVDIVGPADLVVVVKTLDPLDSIALTSLVGPCPYLICPAIFNITSPVSHATKLSPKTIGFYGDKDPLIPKSQMKILKHKLDSFGVVNNFTMYRGGHYLDWKDEDKLDMINQIVGFLKNNW